MQSKRVTLCLESKQETKRKENSFFLTKSKENTLIKQQINFLDDKKKEANFNTPEKSKNKSKLIFKNSSAKIITKDVFLKLKDELAKKYISELSLVSSFEPRFFNLDKDFSLKKVDTLAAKDNNNNKEEEESVVKSFDNSKTKVVLIEKNLEIINLSLKNKDLIFKNFINLNEFFIPTLNYNKRTPFFRKHSQIINKEQCLNNLSKTKHLNVSAFKFQSETKVKKEPEKIENVNKRTISNFFKLK